MDKRFVLIAILVFFLSIPMIDGSTSSVLAAQKTETNNIFSVQEAADETDNDTVDLSDKTDTTQKLDKTDAAHKLDKSDAAQKFDKMDAAEKKEFFETLGTLDQVKLFKELTDEEKIKFFQDLDEEEQVKLFKNLDKKDKAKLFKGLDEEEQVKLFKTLDKSDQSTVFQGLNQLEQTNLLASLTKKEELSEIENILSGQFPKDIAKELEQYGYSFFNKESSTFQPMMNVPVGSDYVIGPGDSFTVYIWGGAEETYNVTVTRDGNIIIPRLGTLNVSGLTFAELKNFLGYKFKEYYTDFEMNITMDSIRTIEIFLVGEATKPGTYSVSSLSSIVTALYTTGGPTKNGSLRNIRLIRNGKTITTLDLYDFFIKGIKDNDMRLEPGDTIFIPVIEPVAGISGYVKRPAIYEMKGSQTIGDIIDLAGGVLSVSYLQNVVVERITDHQKRVIKTFNLDPNNQQTNDNLKIQLQDGDLIKIYPVHQTMRHVVYLKGHVKYPQEYEFKDGMKILDLIPSYDYLLNEPYLPIGQIVRLMPPDLHPEIVEFNLGALMSGDATQNLALEDQDRVIIYSKWDKKDRPKVTISGAVRKPGSYTLFEGMTIKDLVFKAGNLTDKAYTDKGDLTRFTEAAKGAQSLRFDFSVKNALEGNDKDNLPLQADDMINIREKPRYKEAMERKITLEGAFLFPGEYTFSEGERISSVIQRAGGLTEDAYSKGAIFEREAVKETQKVRSEEYITQLENDVSSLTTLAAGSSLDTEDMATLQTTLSDRKELLEKLRKTEPTGRMVIKLDKVLISPSSDLDFQLRAGDRLIVSKRQDFITIMGEVYNPIALLIEDGKDVDYYLDKVGGVSKKADNRQIYIVKADGTVISKRQGGLFSMGLWEQNNSRWSFGRFGSIKLEPGDSIIVPEKLVTTNWLKNLSSVTTILYNLAVAAHVIQDF